MLRKLRVHARLAAALGVTRGELAGVRLLKTALPIPDRKRVPPGLRRHEADAEHAAVGGVAETVHLPRLAAFAGEFADDNDVGERIEMEVT